MRDLLRFKQHAARKFSRRLPTSLPLQHYRLPHSLKFLRKDEVSEPHCEGSTNVDLFDDSECTDLGSDEGGIELVQMEDLLHELIGGEGHSLGGDTANVVERKASVQSLLDPILLVHVGQGLAQ